MTIDTSTEAVEAMFDRLRIHPGSPADLFFRALAAERDAAVQRAEKMREALNERDLFSNPNLLMQAADEIDCDGQCDHIWREGDTNAAGCSKSERGDYCPNDLAETLRAVVRVAAMEGK